MGHLQSEHNIINGCNITSHAGATPATSATDIVFKIHSCLYSMNTLSANLNGLAERSRQTAKRLMVCRKAETNEFDSLWMDCINVQSDGRSDIAKKVKSFLCF